MAIHHHLDTTGRCFKAGNSAEKNFSRLANEKGYKATEATKKQEIYEHWDFRVEKDGKSHKVEVKSEKDFFIKDQSGQLTKDFLLVEFSGVTGHAGWLYGQADIVAFEKPDGFYLVPRTTLVRLAEKLCVAKLVSNKRDMLYKSYGREGRQDEVSAILLKDVIETKNFSFWKK